MKRGVCIFAITLVTVGVPGYAQEPSPLPPAATSSYIDAVGGLTLDDAIARALEREPTLRAVRTQIDVAQGARVQAELRPNPSISFARQQEPGGTDNQTRLELQWPLDLYRKAGRVAVAERTIDVAQQATADQ